MRRLHFSDIRNRIEKEEHARLEKEMGYGKSKERLSQLEKTIERLKNERSELDAALDEAAETIFRLYRKVALLTDENRYILERVSYARSASKVVDRAFEGMKFDSLITSE